VHTIPLALGEEQIGPGTLGFIIVALLGLALFFLVRSMNRQIRKINIPDEAREAQDPASERDADTEGDGVRGGQQTTKTERTDG